MQSDLKMYAIRFDIHKVKRQEVVTYLSPVKVFATRIKIINRQKLSLIAILFPSKGLDCLIYRSSRGKDLGLQSEQDCVTEIKKIAVFKKPNCTVLWCKMQKHK